jgi:DNA-binding MarR family transcriptional regulator
LAERDHKKEVYGMKKNTTAADKRSIVVNKGDRIFMASSEEELQVLSSPQRQRIFKILQSGGIPMHGKEIGDRAGVKAASAHYHLKKLEKIGVVRQSHTQVINGITARYYEVTVDSVILGEDFLEATDDGLTRQKMLLMYNAFNANRDSFIRSLNQRMQQEQPGGTGENKLHLALDFLLYLSAEDARQLQKDINELAAKYSKPSSGKEPHSVWLSINWDETRQISTQ